MWLYETFNPHKLLVVLLFSAPSGVLTKLTNPEPTSSVNSISGGFLSRVGEALPLPLPGICHTAKVALICAGSATHESTFPDEDILFSAEGNAV